MTIVTNKEIIIKELENNQADIEKGDWDQFFYDVWNDVGDQPYKEVKYIMGDFVEFFQENGIDFTSSIKTVYSFMFYPSTDVLEKQTVKLPNVELVMSHGFRDFEGDIYFSKKLKKLEKNALSFCTLGLNIHYEGTKEEFKHNVELEKGWEGHSGDLKIICSDGTYDIDAGELV